MFIGKYGLAAAAVALATALPAAVQAETLTMGMASEASSIDPHYHNLSPNNALRRHMFESLTNQDETQQLGPLLAESWKPISETAWEFNLRKGVKFHDGSDFTALDVVYSACRVPNVPNSPSNFVSFTSAISDFEIKDDHTLIVHTSEPTPLLPTYFANWGILSATANGVSGDIKYDKENCGLDAFPSTVDFNNGSASIGTGPYKFKEFVKGDRFVMEANANYWGGKPEWDEVIQKPITNAAARMAALLAGDVDFVDNPPTQDLAELKENPKFDVSQGLSNRVIYLHMDQFGPSTFGVKGTGKPDAQYEGEGPCATEACEKNPFLDVRVRQALSKAINRDAIVEKIMGGVAVPAGELLPQGFFGTNPGAKHEAYDPDGAKKLLAEAGYPNGFELVLGTPNDRYINDAKIAQVIAQMFTRIGVKTTVNAMTKSVFFKTRNTYEFSIYLAGWGAGTGEMSNPLRALVGTRNKETGLGGTNRGRYSNPSLDEKILTALATVDDAKREEILRTASREAMEDYSILPLHFEVTSWAHRKGLSHKARADQYTLATGVHKAN
ncbi:ABC transporter substrate-binding protein [Sneathiella chinensis]|uniref:Peptide ABC transporter substrate-binding protein n=1 Tax=Sneathiella chinensis TaxID=349750 RepID=A0ABQ5U577_9PROT|nr:ABC transporter substrate-binding protein [Sneathiella chinensis]GLQ06901.1 peptide ABC transporter substrate-binding protein [Sneathiella chinensis]